MTATSPPVTASRPSRWPALARLAPTSSSTSPAGAIMYVYTRWDRASAEQAKMAAR